MTVYLSSKRNIAILAHVDAGKTTVSERLLFLGDAIQAMGEVDEGLATLDYLEEERRRGITIEAGIASFTWKGVRTTLVDTPGHVDFGVEVDFALRAVDGVVLVLSGVSGIESQSLQAWEKVRKNGNRAMLFINKLDVPGADYLKVLEQIRTTFQVTPVLMALPILDEAGIVGVVDVLNGQSFYQNPENVRRPRKDEIPEALEYAYLEAHSGLLDAATQFSDSLMQAWLDGQVLKGMEIAHGLEMAFSKGTHVPVYLGAAIKTVGVRQLMNGINRFLPPPEIRSELRDHKGLIVKVRHYRGVGKIYLVKLFSAASEIEIPGAKWYEVEAESLKEIAEAGAGSIVALGTSATYRIGDYVVSAGEPQLGASVQTAYLPLLQSRLELVDPSDFSMVERKLAEMAEADPSIALEPDVATGGWLLSAVGELQLEVFCRRLMDEQFCKIAVGHPSVKFLEKLKSGIIGIRNTSVLGEYEIQIVLDAHTVEFPKESDWENQLVFSAGPDTIECHEALMEAFGQYCREGILGKGQIGALRVEIKEISLSNYQAPLHLLIKCFKDALSLNLEPIRFDLYEPIMKLEVIVPDEFCGAILADLASKGGRIRKMDSDGHNSIISLEIPLEKTFGYTTLLRSLSKGFGVYVLTYEKHGPRRSI